MHVITLIHNVHLAVTSIEGDAPGEPEVQGSVAYFADCFEQNLTICCEFLYAVISAICPENVSCTVDGYTFR